MKLNKRQQRARAKAQISRQQKHNDKDMTRKHNHITLINQQLKACDEFTQLPDNLLADVAVRLDQGQDFPAEHKDKCIAILDKVHSDNIAFKEELDTIKAKVQQFRKSEHSTEDLMFGSIMLCEELETLRNKHLGLYAIDTATLNEHMLDTYLANNTVTAEKEPVSE